MVESGVSSDLLASSRIVPDRIRLDAACLSWRFRLSQRWLLPAPPDASHGAHARRRVAAQFQRRPRRRWKRILFGLHRAKSWTSQNRVRLLLPERPEALTYVRQKRQVGDYAIWNASRSASYGLPWNWLLTKITVPRGERSLETCESNHNDICGSAAAALRHVGACVCMPSLDIGTAVSDLRSHRSTSNDVQRSVSNTINPSHRIRRTGSDEFLGWRCQRVQRT